MVHIQFYGTYFVQTNDVIRTATISCTKNYDCAMCMYLAKIDEQNMRKTVIGSQCKWKYMLARYESVMNSRYAILLNQLPA